MSQPSNHVEREMELRLHFQWFNDVSSVLTKCPVVKTMDSVKNLAGNDVSIFLFRFELSGNGIHFVLNEAIAADMYQDVDEKLKPLAHPCCETLVRYKHLSVSNTIMDGNILDTGEFEVMLSRGLGGSSALNRLSLPKIFQSVRNQDTFD
jgi:hypothetical protein